MKSLLIKYLPALVIALVMFLFHSRLFLPEPSFYVTPDYGRSDSWHLSIANKFFYAQELKQNRIPIWNSQIGMGYPTLAEGQTAIFFLPNLIAFRILPFVWAYNLTLVFSFILAGWGTYLFVRSLGLTKLAALYAGTIFPLGGFFVFHVQHHNLLQTASIVPILFWALNEYLKNKKVIFLLLISIFYSQQIFAGFPQIAVYTVIVLFIYLALKNFSLKHTITFLIAILLGVIVSAVQLLPTYEFILNSTNQINSKAVVSDFPYKFKNLLQLLDPYILGTPRDGSYPQWVVGSWGIFWESQMYTGLIPLALFLFIGFTFWLPRHRLKPEIKILLAIFIIATILSLGRDTPLVRLFSLPPLSMFRVPSRFLLFSQLAIVILSSYLLVKLEKKVFVYLLISIISLGNLFFYFFPYNPASPSKLWLSKPDVAGVFTGENFSRVYALGDIPQWNSVYASNGWKTGIDYYLFARNFLAQNSNNIFNVNQLMAYERLISQRLSFSIQTLHHGISLVNGNYFITPEVANLLASLGVSHIVTNSPVYEINFKKVYETTYDDKRRIYVYKNIKKAEYSYYAKSIKTAQTKEKMVLSLLSRDHDNFQVAHTEKELIKVGGDNAVSILNLEKNTHNSKTFTLQALKDELLIINESFYPGWEASLDNKKVDIHPVNVNSIAILIPKGSHILKLSYKPNSLYVGALISSLGITLVLLLLLKFKKAQIA